jgi:hypothetical protein
LIKSIHEKGTGHSLSVAEELLPTAFAHKNRPIIVGNVINQTDRYVGLLAEAFQLLNTRQ